MYTACVQCEYCADTGSVLGVQGEYCVDTGFVLGVHCVVVYCVL